MLPEDAEWQLIVGDLTALPAIGRILETARPDVRTTVVIEVEDPPTVSRCPATSAGCAGA